MKKGKQKASYPKSPAPAHMREIGPGENYGGTEPMVRTQIYLSRREHEFIQAESQKRGEPMAAVIRAFIDEKMEIPEDAWANNPMLRPAVEDPSWVGHEDAAINHDHYIYGGPKKYVKRDGKWVEAPPLPEDYFDNPASAAAYDAEVEKLK